MWILGFSPHAWPFWKWVMWAGHNKNGHQDRLLKTKQTKDERKRKNPIHTELLNAMYGKKRIWQPVTETYETIQRPLQMTTTKWFWYPRHFFAKEKARRNIGVVCLKKKKECKGTSWRLKCWDPLKSSDSMGNASVWKCVKARGKHDYHFDERIPAK